MNIDLVALSLDVRTVEEVQTTFEGVAIMRLLEDTAGPYQTNLMGADRTHTMSFYAMKYENYLGANEKTAVSNSSQESFLLLAPRYPRWPGFGLPRQELEKFLYSRPCR
jgi:hypothetical protein